MDLLNDYGSSDSEAEEDTTSSSGPKEAGESADKKLKTNDNKPDHSTVSTTNQTTTSETNAVPRTKPPSSSKAAALSRKMLSLQAVLPPHIFAQLTKSQREGETATNDDDDDDDDDHDSPPSKSKQTTRTTVAAQSQDPGVSRLLQALHGTGTQDDTNDNGKTPDKKPNQPSLPMGAAFLSTTTTIIKPSEESAVRDIHVSETTTQTTKPVDSEMEEETKTTLESTSRSLLAPKFSTTAPHYVQPSLAPDVPVTGEPMTSATTAADALYPVEPEPQNQRQSHVPKRNRKEMEKLLRHGHLDQMDNDTMVQLEQASPHAFVPQPEVTQVPTHGVRNVPTQMYDPSAGGTVTGVRGRGKNQISHLLGQAANLELARARGMNGSGGAGGTSHRASAKRKYGW